VLELDWSAVSLLFTICVAAVRDKIDDVCELMRKNGNDG
jgi:hypothetical protein